MKINEKMITAVANYCRETGSDMSLILADMRSARSVVECNYTISQDALLGVL